MEHIITEKELKYILCGGMYVETGKIIRPDEIEIHFIKDGSSTRVDAIKIRRKE